MLGAPAGGGPANNFVFVKIGLGWRPNELAVMTLFYRDVSLKAAKRNACRGFTLIELLLTLVLVLLLLGAMVINFAGLQRGVQLDEGVEQFESLVRYARAHAANTGCRVQLTFEELIEEDFAAPLGNVFVTWEPDPLEKPGQFHPLNEAAMLVESLLELVEVDDVRPLSAQGHPAAFDEEAAALAFAPIMFYPDGSSDSAEVVFVARESEDERRVALQIIGATGTLKRRAVREGLVEPLLQDATPESTEVVP